MKVRQSKKFFRAIVLGLNKDKALQEGLLTEDKVMQKVCHDSSPKVPQARYKKQCGLVLTSVPTAAG